MASRFDFQKEADFIKPRLRVFLSVDLIGSTQYKINTQGTKFVGKDNDAWPTVSMLFYTNFQKIFSENWEEFKRLIEKTTTDNNFGPAPKLWKALGDELIFSKECHSERDVCAVVQVWRKTINDFKTDWSHPELKLKSGMWLVGSPVTNWEVSFLREDPKPEDMKLAGNPLAYNFHILRQYYDEQCSRKINIDFIGPSMDCGFRLLSHCDERRQIVSADLAKILLSVAGWWKNLSFRKTYPTMLFYYDGTENLKGISRYGIDYPIIWMDAFEGNAAADHTKFAKAVDRLTSRSHAKVEDLESFLETFLDDMDGFPSGPFICAVAENGEIQNAFGEISEDYIEKINVFRKNYIDAVEQENIMFQSLIASGEGDSPDNSDLKAAVERVPQKP